MSGYAQPLRVVILLSGLSAGGTERVAVRVSEWLCAAGHDVTIVTLTDTKADFYTTPAGVSRIGLDLMRPSRGVLDSLWSNWRRVREIRAVAKARRADVVIALAGQVNIMMLLALIGMACRKIISERSNPTADKGPLPWRILRRLTYPMADLHVAQSNHVADWMRRRFPNLPSMVIGNTAGDLPAGIALAARAAQRDGAPVRLITVARLTPEKGVDVLLEAFSAARAQGAPVELEILGDGSERGALEGQAEALGLGASVSFAGRKPNVFEILNKRDIFVLPSRLEGFPNAMIEAMAVGLPVIAARCAGGAADVLGDAPERYALEFPPGDAPALAAAIVRLAGSAELRRTLGSASLERARSYGPETIAAAWRAVVEQPASYARTAKS